MSNRPISFRVCDFSEQLISATPDSHYDTYSAVAHVDGKVIHVQRVLRPEFCPPISVFRSQAWLDMLEQIMKDKQ